MDKSFVGMDKGFANEPSRYFGIHLIQSLADSLTRTRAGTDEIIPQF